MLLFEYHLECGTCRRFGITRAKSLKCCWTSLLSTTKLRQSWILHASGLLDRARTHPVRGAKSLTGYRFLRTPDIVLYTHRAPVWPQDFVRALLDCLGGFSVGLNQGVPQKRHPC